MNQENGKPNLTAGDSVHVKRNRYGYEIDGYFLRRVTTLTGGLPKPWLGGWAAKEVATWAAQNREAWKDLPERDAIKLLKGKPWEKRDDAADRGSAIHAAIEAYLRDEPLPDGMNEEEFDCAVQAEQILERYSPKVLAAELTVFSLTHEYAGTLDLWLVLGDGTRWIWDWKSSRSIYVDHAVQQSAYRHGEWAVVQKTPVGDEDSEEWKGKLIPWGPKRAERLGLVHVTPEDAKLHPIRLEVEHRLWETFRAAKHVKLFQLDTDDYRSDPRVEVYEPATSGPEADEVDDREEVAV